MKTGLLALAMAAALGAAPISSAAQAAPKAGERVVVTACPYAGVTANCLLINGADGTVYNITGAKPRPRLESTMIRLRGTVSDKLSLCNQGAVLDQVRWRRTGQKCPN